MKKIDIIIPVYNAHKVLPKALHSLCTQSIINDCNVILVNDKSKEKYDSVIKYFQKELDIIVFNLNENVGPGFARQYGVDHSSTPYIIFMDSDDTWATSFAIESLYECITEDDITNYVTSDFIERKDGQRNLIQDSPTWLFGKIFKRSFLEKHNIRFRMSRCNEDVAYNLNCGGYTDHKHLHEITYIWEDNPNSITAEDDYSFHSIPAYLEAHSILKDIREKDPLFYPIQEDFEKLINKSFIYLYFNYNMYYFDKYGEQLDGFFDLIVEYCKIYPFVLEEERIKKVEDFYGFQQQAGAWIIPEIGITKFIEEIKKRM